MKRRLVRFITAILSVVIGAASFAGCHLVTKNNERDLDQVVATVEVTEKEEIYKKDLVMGYLNYGYIYAQYYGYDAARTYNLILNGLIENRIVVQCAYDKFETDNKIEDASAAKFTAERYLSADEITDAKYTAYKSINDLLDGYSEDNSDTEKKDSVIGEVRTVPTGAAKAEKDVDKAAYVADIETNGFDVDGNEYKRAAFNKVITLLKTNNLLGNDYNGKITETEYFKRLLKSNYENEIIKNYEESVIAEVKASLTYADLEAAYNEKLDGQKDWSNSEFVSALSSASSSSPILYSAYGTYGYIYNLLIGVNDYQQDMLDDLKEEHNITEAAYSARRKDILAGTLAKDLRSSWIASGYDFDFATKKFTGDYTFAKDAANSLEFQGEVEEVRQKTEDKDGVYAVKNVTSFGLDEFVDFVKTYVYNNESLTAGTTNDDIYAAFTRGDKPAEYDAKINELLFAFSTDSGSLNTYKGYVIKPAVDGAATEEYVKTFGDAGRALLTEGGSSFKVVASDFGYHFMFCSEVFTATYEFATLNDYLDTLNIDKGSATTWEEYFNAQKADWENFEEENNYVYLLANELISGKLNSVASESKTAIINKYRYEEKNKVVIYKDRFADLLG
ncbi:MAG: hypothetical protein IJU83_00710 [Clostridia bacterium]|nr:hypothetical protein [Clostridia bacterium]